MAFAGVKLAERIFGKLNNHRALIVGAGATSEQVVRHLCDRGIKQLRVLNRTAEHAVDLAARFGGEVVPWENLTAALEWPDLIVTSVSSSEPILTRAMIERAMAARGNRALLLIDLGVPRNVAADAAGPLQHVSVQHRRPDGNRRAKQKGARGRNSARGSDHRRANRKIPALAGGSGGGRGARGSSHQAGGGARGVPAASAWRRCRNLSEQDRAQVAAMLEEFLDRVVLDPAERMRGIPELRRKLQNLEALRDLFHLDREKP